MLLFLRAFDASRLLEKNVSEECPHLPYTPVLLAFKGLGSHPACNEELIILFKVIEVLWLAS